MAREIMTFIVCLDDHKSYTEDIRKRFSDTSRYTVESYHSQKEFLQACKKLIDPASCKVAIIGVPEAKDQYEAVEEMTMDIKRSDPRTGLILIVPPERMEDLKKVVRFNIDAYVAKNANSILRIHNTVKKLISERTISINRKKRNFALYVLLVFIIVSAIAILVARFKLPHYF